MSREGQRREDSLDCLVKCKGEEKKKMRKGKKEKRKGGKKRERERERKKYSWIGCWAVGKKNRVVENLVCYKYNIIEEKVFIFQCWSFIYINLPLVFLCCLENK